MIPKPLSTDPIGLRSPPTNAPTVTKPLPNSTHPPPPSKIGSNGFVVSQSSPINFIDSYKFQMNDESRDLLADYLDFDGSVPNDKKTPSHFARMNFSMEELDATQKLKEMTQRVSANGFTDQPVECIDLGVYGLKSSSESIGGIDDSSLDDSSSYHDSQGHPQSMANGRPKGDHDSDCCSNEPSSVNQSNSLNNTQQLLEDELFKQPVEVPPQKHDSIKASDPVAIGSVGRLTDAHQTTPTPLEIKAVSQEGTDHDIVPSQSCDPIEPHKSFKKPFDSEGKQGIDLLESKGPIDHSHPSLIRDPCLRHNWLNDSHLLKQSHPHKSSTDHKQAHEHTDHKLVNDTDEPERVPERVCFDSKPRHHLSTKTVSIEATFGNIATTQRVSNDLLIAAELKQKELLLEEGRLTAELRAIESKLEGLRRSVFGLNVKHQEVMLVMAEAYNSGEDSVPTDFSLNFLTNNASETDRDMPSFFFDPSMIDQSLPLLHHSASRKRPLDNPVTNSVDSESKRDSGGLWRPPLNKPMSLLFSIDPQNNTHTHEELVGCVENPEPCFQKKRSTENRPIEDRAEVPEGAHAMGKLADDFGRPDDADAHGHYHTSDMKMSRFQTLGVMKHEPKRQGQVVPGFAHPAPNHPDHSRRREAKERSLNQILEESVRDSLGEQQVLWAHKKVSDPANEFYFETDDCYESVVERQVKTNAHGPSEVLVSPQEQGVVCKKGESVHDRKDPRGLVGKTGGSFIRAQGRQKGRKDGKHRRHCQQTNV